MTETGIEGGVHWVKDRETGEVLNIEWDEDYRAEILAFYDRQCAHPETEVRRVKVANGSIQVRSCCTVCGTRVGNAQKQEDAAWVASLPIQDASEEATYANRRADEKYEIAMRHAARQRAERGEFTKFYQEYLASEGWAAIRQKVIRRCGNLCEGCGDQPVEHVHHMTYAHLGHEFLFELLGLCRDCHDRVHDKPLRSIR